MKKVITYDLRKPGRNYQALYARLAELKAQRILESVWVAQSTATCAAIRDYLAAAIDDGDGLYVAGLTGEAAWRGLKPGAPAVLTA